MMSFPSILCPVMSFLFKQANSTPMASFYNQCCSAHDNEHGHLASHLQVNTRYSHTTQKHMLQIYHSKSGDPFFKLLVNETHLRLVVCMYEVKGAAGGQLAMVTRQAYHSHISHYISHYVLIMSCNQDLFTSL